VSKRSMLTCLTFLIPSLTFAGNIDVRSTGEEVGYWSTHSVIYAKVTGTERLTSEEYMLGTHRLQVLPQATLAGNFDSALYSTLDLGVWVSPWISNCPKPPESAFVLLVIQKRGEDHFVSPCMPTYMPKASSIVEVEGFTDPLVEETIESLRSVRRRSPF
jgi:hypothetical protein